MNRLLKFRIPHFDHNGVFKCFSYWGTIDHKGEPSLDHSTFSAPSQNGFTKGWHEQFTRFEDKNDIEIYEGDKLSFTVFDYNDHDTQYTGVVVFVGSRFMIWNSVESEYYDSDGGFDLDWVCAQDCEIEVTGHIHYSPTVAIKP